LVFVWLSLAIVEIYFFFEIALFIATLEQLEIRFIDIFTSKQFIATTIMKKNLSIIIFVFLGAVSIMVYYQWKKPSLVNGDNALEVSGVSLGGDIITLSQFKGDYILLEFWGSWCGPCRKNHPKLVQLHQEFADQSFDRGASFHIFSYALEESEAAWKNAILKDKLSWTSHAADFDLMKSTAANSYGVRSIPANFLIDPDFRIIGVNLDDRSIRDILLRRLVK